ncbi:hypothetical protein V493_07583, partial [Pseudogymnoascus sp. VKM F-4281 (FW-2241)]
RARHRHLSPPERKPAGAGGQRLARGRRHEKGTQHVDLRPGIRPRQPPEGQPAQQSQGAHHRPEHLDEDWAEGGAD